MLDKSNAIYLFVAIAFTIGKLSSGQHKYNEFTVSLISQCSETDPSYCALVCTIDSPYINGYKWKYDSQDPLLGYEPTVQITDGFNTTGNMTHMCSTLTLNPYYAGYYYCYMYVPEDNVNTELKRHIKIDTQNSGSLIHGPCENETDCLALNSTCLKPDATYSQKQCECAGDYYIDPFNIISIPACVAPSDEGDRCTYDVQCAKPAESYRCLNRVCTCTGTKTTVEEKSDEVLCLQPVPLTYPCYFDEQCTLVAINSECRGTCECEYGYLNTDGINYYDWYCNDIRRFSGAEIAGIVIGTLLGFGIICSIVYLIWTKGI